MSRLPIPGSDDGAWGDILNDFLSVAHNGDGTAKTGTTAGTVAAGNDSRITGAVQSGGAAGGDLSGTYPDPTVAKVNGVAVTTTPSAGKVLTATSASAATWQNPPISRQQTIWANGFASTVIATVGTWTPTYFRDSDTGGQYVGWLNFSGGSQNDSITFDFVALAGTFSIELYHLPFTNRGIYTIQIDGSSVGTIDGYAASLAAARGTLTGVSIASSGQHTLKVLMATKNASSSGFFGLIERIVVTQTA